MQMDIEGEPTFRADKKHALDPCAPMPSLIDIENATRLEILRSRSRTLL